ncbi:hypothetical protein [Luteimonas notoginsengisoli]|uniref:Uncharacterized protein n=1 Tax=Luteimonas notoginsengisoli TaxID=1578200 RepID=A0ABV7UU99_9GAMM
MTPASHPLFRNAANAATRAAAPPLAAWLLGALFLGAIAVLSLPAARADSAAFGWMPLWLLGMPLASLAALAAARLPLRLPRRRMPDSSATMRRRRPGTTQARRRAVPARARLPHAA